MARNGGAEDVEKMAFVPHKEEQKGKLSRDPMVETSWKSTNYSALVEESISLVGKSTGMLSTTSGVSTPHYPHSHYIQPIRRGVVHQLHIALHLG